MHAAKRSVREPANMRSSLPGRCITDADSPRGSGYAIRQNPVISRTPAEDVFRTIASQKYTSEWSCISTDEIQAEDAQEVAGLRAESLSGDWMTESASTVGKCGTASDKVACVVGCNPEA